MANFACSFCAEQVARGGLIRALLAGNSCPPPRTNSGVGGESKQTESLGRSAKTMSCKMLTVPLLLLLLSSPRYPSHLASKRWP